MDQIRHRVHSSRSTNTFWHIDSTRNLAKHKIIAIGGACVHAPCVMWLKCSSNNKGKNTYRFLKEEINNQIAPL